MSITASSAEQKIWIAIDHIPAPGLGCALRDFVRAAGGEVLRAVAPKADNSGRTEMLIAASEGRLRDRIEPGLQAMIGICHIHMESEVMRQCWHRDHEWSAQS